MWHYVDFLEIAEKLTLPNWRACKICSTTLMTTTTTTPNNQKHIYPKLNGVTTRHDTANTNTTNNDNHFYMCALHLNVLIGSRMLKQGHKITHLHASQPNTQKHTIAAVTVTDMVSFLFGLFFFSSFSLQALCWH